MMSVSHSFDVLTDVTDDIIHVLTDVTDDILQC
jgi:hypothetical protein